MWIRKALVLLAVMASTVVMPAPPALACSCMPIDAAATLGEVPAAFVGTVVDVREADNPTDLEDAVFTFRVDEWVKGDLGDTVEMRSSSSGASCGFEMRPGQQSGIIVATPQGRCGRYVAAMDATLVDGDVDYSLSVFDLEAVDPLVSRAKMLEFGRFAWVDDETIAYALSFHLHDEEGGEVPAEESGTVQLFRASDLDLVAEWNGWTAGTPVVIDGMLYGLTYPGSKLVTAPAASGPMTEIRSFPGSVQGLVPVYGGPELDASAARPRQATGSTVPPATPAPGAAPNVAVPTAAGGSPDPGQAVPPGADGGSGISTTLVVGALLVAAAAIVAGVPARRRNRRTGSR